MCVLWGRIQIAKYYLENLHDCPFLCTHILLYILFTVYHMKCAFDGQRWMMMWSRLSRSDVWICATIVRSLYQLHDLLLDSLQDGLSRKWFAGGTGTPAPGNGHPAREVQFWQVPLYVHPVRLWLLALPTWYWSLQGLQVYYKNCRCRYSSGKDPHNSVVT